MRPGRARAGSWKQRDLPPPVGRRAKTSRPARVASQNLALLRTKGRIAEGGFEQVGERGHGGGRWTAGGAVAHEKVAPFAPPTCCRALRRAHAEPVRQLPYGGCGANPAAHAPRRPAAASRRGDRPWARHGPQGVSRPGWAAHNSPAPGAPAGCRPPKCSRSPTRPPSPAGRGNQRIERREQAEEPAGLGIGGGRSTVAASRGRSERRQYKGGQPATATAATASSTRRSSARFSGASRRCRSFNNASQRAVSAGVGWGRRGSPAAGRDRAGRTAGDCRRGRR